MQLVPFFIILSGLISVASLALGTLSLILPAKSIKFYQWIMARFNWQVVPINMSRELRNTRIFGAWLILLGSLLAVLVLAKV